MNVERANVNNGCSYHILVMLFMTPIGESQLAIQQARRVVLKPLASYLCSYVFDLTLRYV